MLKAYPALRQQACLLTWLFLFASAFSCAAVTVAPEMSVMNGVARAAGSYRLTPGDSFAMLFHFSGLPESDHYLIATGDELSLEFIYQPDLNRNVVVRPDGRISLPRRDEIMAAGLTPAQLRHNIEAQYLGLLKKPVINIDLKKFQFRTQQLREALERERNGQSVRALLAPDGRVALPLLQPVMAAGLSLAELEAELNTQYQRSFQNLRLSLLLESVAGNRVFVFGEVRTPGALVMGGPMTVLQALAQAGGPLESGSLADVRLILPAASGQTDVRQIDLSEIATAGALNGDILLPANASIYVPPTGLTRVGRLVDQILRRVFLFNGVGMGITYEINR